MLKINKRDLKKGSNRGSWGVSGGSSLTKKGKEGPRKRKKKVKYKQVIKLGNKSGQERERRRSSFKPGVMREGGRKTRESVEME